MRVAPHTDAEAILLQGLRGPLALERAQQGFTCPSCGLTVLIPANKHARRKHCPRSCATASHNSRYRVGSQNPNWRGGRALHYGPGWKATKERVRERDPVCRSCGKPPQENGRALDVHHVTPFRFSGDNSMVNLVALCRSCHMRADDHGRRHGRRFVGPQQLILRPPSQRELRRRRGQERRTARRIMQSRALALRQRGRSLRQIASAIGVSHQTVANWLAILK
jgi:5-methylcytosine-specific restriction endonuclease McrA